MSIIKSVPGTGLPPTNPTLQREPIRTVAVNTKVDSLASLITHVSGMKWIVEYYSQLLTADDETAGLELNRLPVYQQYLKIKQFELRVESPLVPSQNTETNEMTLQGSATLYIGVVPKLDDVFLADIGDGRYGLFKITLAPQKSILRDTTYSIEYQLQGYGDDYLADLDSKVQKEVTFVRDFVDIGKIPLLIDSEYSDLLDIREQLYSLPEYYFQMFFNSTRATMLVPDQELQTYDWAVPRYLREQVSTSTHPKYQDVRLLNCDDTHIPPITIYDALSHRDSDLLRVMVVKATRLNCKAVRVQPRVSSVHHSGVKVLYYPAVENQMLGLDMLTPLEPSKPRQFNYPIDVSETSFDEIPTDPPTPRPIIHPVTIDDYYVLSGAFYRRELLGMSSLELLVHQFLLGEALDLSKLLRVAENSQLWGKVEQFYYIPILLTLISHSIGDIN